MRVRIAPPSTNRMMSDGGVEIETSRDNASIDCHYPHVGLHLMLSFLTTGERVVVDDVLVAFLRNADYRITVPKTKATTLKASFTRAPFVSLLLAREYGEAFGRGGATNCAGVSTD